MKTLILETSYEDGSLKNRDPEQSQVLIAKLINNPTGGARKLGDDR